jgi:hypothetical protein
LPATSPIERLRDAVKAAAAHASSHGLLASPFKERNLQDVFVKGLAAAGTGPVKENFSVAFEEWPGVGPVDVALLSDERLPQAFIELKCGTGTLYNCVWDVAKLAVATAHGHAPLAFLLAAAPASDWRGAQGAEFFETLVWSTWTDVLERYKKLWAFWQGDVTTRPKLLPKVIRTTAVGRVALVGGREPWELRCAQVQHGSTDWIDVETGISLERWKSKFTWHEGDLEFLSKEEVEKILGRGDDADE